MLTFRMDSDFFGNARRIIQGAEGFFADIYNDSVGIPTTGFGYALLNRVTINNIEQLAFNTDATNDFAAIGITITPAQRNQLTNIATQLNAGPYTGALATAVRAATETLDMGIRDITEPEAQILFQLIFDRKLGGLQRRLRTLLGNQEGNRVYAALAGSTELVAIIDIVFNGGERIVDQGLARALSQGNRAEAWYEIRYNSNGGASRGVGIAKRRFYEAEIFSLYENPAQAGAQVGTVEARQVYQAFSRNRSAILAYEAEFGLQPDGTRGSARDRSGRTALEAANSTDVNLTLLADGRVDSIVQSLGPAKLALLADLQLTYPVLSGINPDDYLSTSIILDPGRNSTRDAIDPDHAATLDARERDAANVEKAINNILVGEGGTDILIAGAGDDILIGGTGNDTLDGGAGDDSYIYNTGDGADTILDSDGNGSITISVDQTKISGTTTQSFQGSITDPLAKGNKDTWASIDGRFTYQFLSGNLKDGGTLVIKGAGLGTDGQIKIENFKNGNLGINLNDDYAIALRDSLGNPFLSSGFTPSTGTVNLNELAGKTLAVTLNQSARSGDKIVLKLIGGALDLWSIVDGANTTSFANGEIEIELIAGQTQVSFALLNTGDIDIDQAYTLSATLVAGAAIDGAMPVTANLSINLDTMDEQVQDIQIDNTILGDQAPAMNAQGSIQYDQFGNIIPAGPEIGRADTIYDTPGNDQINAGGGNDTISLFRGGQNVVDGGEGDDTIAASNSNAGDHLLGGLGMDRIDAGSGKDVLEGGAGTDLLAGGAGDDQLFAVAKVDIQQLLDGNAMTGGQITDRDWLSGGAGDDTIVGSAGDDGLSGGEGKDLIFGGAGADNILSDAAYLAYNFDWTFTDVPPSADDPYGSRVFQVNGATYPPGGAGDTVYAGAGDDYVWAGLGDDLVYGDAGNDSIQGEEGNDILLGGVGNDFLYGDAGYEDVNTHGNDFLDGGEGDDQLSGQGGTDTLFGGAGDDKLYGDDKDENAGDDYLDGEDGNDLLIGAAGADTLFGGAGDDKLYGESSETAADKQGDDYLDGEDGDDELVGGGGADTLYGGAGKDKLFGDSSETPAEQQGDDYLDGEDGDDELVGGGGADTLFGGAGDDKLYGESSDTPEGVQGDDYLDGEDGNDTLVGNGGNDFLVGGNGNDLLAGGTGNDQLFGDAGIDELQGGDGDDQLDGGTENDKLFGGNGVDILRGGDGADEIVGDNGNDQLFGDAGNDRLFGLADNDVLDGGDGDDVLDGGLGDDTLTGGLGNDLVAGGDGIDNLSGGDGADQLQGGLGDDTLDGGAGDDVLIADAGNDVLTGGDGNDQLQGLDGADTLEGGAGNDTLYGDAGNDSYLFNLGDGQDLVYEGQATGGDVLRFGSGIQPTDITIARSGLNLILIHTNGTDQVTIANWYYSSAYQLGRIEFTDSATVWTPDYLSDQGLYQRAGTAGNDSEYGTSYNETFYGYAGDDTLYGNGGADILVGGVGNDILGGGDGADTYIFNLGDGNDLIQEGGAGVDVLQFGAGISSADVSAERIGNDLVLQHTNGADSVRVQNWYLTPSYQVEQVTFNGDGALLSAAQLSILGTDIAHQYTLDLGNGAKTIDDWGGVDSLTFGMGIADADILISRSGNDLSLAHTNGLDRITVKDWFNSIEKQVENISFQDSGTVLTETVLTTPFLTINGTVGNDSLLGGDAYGEVFTASTGNDTVFAGAGNDDINGGAGDDTIYGGAGNDLITGGVGNDTLRGDAGYDTYYFRSGDGQDYINDSTEFSDGRLVFGQGLLSSLTTSTVNFETVYSFGPTDSVRLSSGTDLALFFELQGGNSADTINGTAYSEIIYGLDGNDTLNGNDGNDELYGGNGNDILEGGGGTDKLYGGAGDDILDAHYIGTTQFPAGYSSSSFSHYYGGAGNDTLYGGGSSDYYYFDLGDRQDTIIDEPYVSSGGVTFFNADDRIVFGAGITPESITAQIIGNDLYIKVSASDGITIRNGFGNGAYWVDKFQFSDGRTLSVQEVIQLALTVHGTSGNDVISGSNVTFAGDVIYGEAGNDTISTQDGNDILIGGTGNDVLDGGYGDDTYRFTRGDGQDTISDSQGVDTIVFDPSITASDIVLSRSVNDLVLSINGSTDSITIKDYIRGSAIIENFSFVDGSSLPSSQEILTALRDINGTSGNDVLTGTDGFDVFYGGDGNDVIAGLGDGDFIYAGSGDDVITGGAGGDYLRGDDGSDTYYLGRGDGADTIVDSAGANDKLVLGSGILFSDINFLVSGSSLQLSIAGASDSVYLADQLIAGDSQLEQLVLANGSAIGLLDVRVGSTANDTLMGTSSDSILYGNSGTDTLTGGAGNDWLNGGAGNDNLTGGAGDDVYVIDSTKDTTVENANEGIDTVLSSITKTLGSNLENLVLVGSSSINGTGNTLNNLLIGNGANNTLSDTTGNDILLGGTGTDTLKDTAGNNLLDGGAGADVLTGGTGRELLIGGTGNDTITPSTGYDIIAFNRGDGVDTVAANTGLDNSISLGGGIRNTDLTFTKSSSDLILGLGSGEQIVLKSWYTTGRTSYKSVVTLQMIEACLSGCHTHLLDVVGRDLAA